MPTIRLLLVGGEREDAYHFLAAVTGDYDYPVARLSDNPHL